MKVLHVIDQLNPGGAERVCIDLANIFSGRGHTVGILVLLYESKLDSSIELGIKTHYLRRKSKWNILNYFEFARICKRYDIVHIHMRHVYRYVMIAKILCRIKSKFVFQDHFGDIQKDGSIPLFYKSLFKPRFYIGVSKTLTNWAINKLKIKSDHVFLLSNIIRKYSSLKAEVHTNQRDLVIVSNIRPTKNIEFAIQISAATNLKLDIIGQLVDKEYHNKLVDQIASLGITENISFVHDCYAVQSHLGKYRLAIHTATSETGPLVLMEYLAQGLNFLAYRTGEVAEILNAKFPNFFMDSFSVQSWKVRVEELISAPIAQKRLTSLFESEYGEDKYYTLCLEIYKKILC